MEIAIRPATEQELPLMYALASRVHRESYADVISPERYEQFLAYHQDDAPRRDRYIASRASAVREGSMLMIGAYDDDGRLVGFKQIRRVSDRRFEGVGLFVSPDMQGHGIGRSLMNEWIRMAPDGAVLQLSVLEKNLRARGLYEHLGFVESGIADKRYFGEKLIVMELKKH